MAFLGINDRNASIRGEIGQRHKDESKIVQRLKKVAKV